MTSQITAAFKTAKALLAIAQTLLGQSSGNSRHAAIGIIAALLRRGAVILLYYHKILPPDADVANNDKIRRTGAAAMQFLLNPLQ